MSELENSVLQKLVELDAVVKAMPTASPKPNLLPIFQNLDELTDQLPRETAPELLHFLRKKSYEKARLWLEGRRDQVARGGCLGD